MSSGLIIGAVCLALGLIASGIGYIYVELKNNKAKNKEDKLSPTKKDLFDNSIAYKKLGIIKFKDWNKNSSGIVLAAGVYKSSSKINNKFVLKNLKKNFSRTKNLKKIDLEDLVITKSEQKSAVVIAPPGTGKTQALLLPTIVYNAYCKDKPNMIITDPKPEILSQTMGHLLKNGYKIINLSTIDISIDENNYLTDFWNPLDQVIFYHKQLLSTNNELEIQKLQSKIANEISFLIEILGDKKKKRSKDTEYFEDGSLLLIKFFISLMLLKVEIGEWNYEKINFKNLLDNVNSFDLFKSIEFVKTINANTNLDKTYKSLGFLNLYLAWIQEGEQNLKSFKTGAATKLSIFDSNYLNLLTSKSTFNIDEIILSKQPYAIFLTINTSSTATSSENKILNIYLELINKKIDYYKKINDDFKQKIFWWMLDEIGNLEPLNFLSNIIQFGRSNNIFALPIFQSEDQIKSKYSNSIINSSEYRILFTNDNTTLAKTIVETEGQREVKLKNNNVIKVNKINISDITNIPKGYIGLWTFKSDDSDKVFSFFPTVYYYMINNKEINNIKNVLNSAYLLSPYKEIINMQKLINYFDIVNKNVNSKQDNKPNQTFKIKSPLQNEELIKTNEIINDNDIDKSSFNNINVDVPILIKEPTITKNIEDLIPKTFYLTYKKLNINDKQTDTIIKNKLIYLNGLFNHLKQYQEIKPNSPKLQQLQAAYLKLQNYIKTQLNKSFNLNELENFIKQIKISGVNIYYEKKF